MFPDDQDSPTGDDIVGAAGSQIGSLGYKRYGYSDNTPAGVPKDHNFIANTLDSAGLGFGDNPSDRPSAADWADPSSTIPGWQPVSNGSVQAGDVLATPKPIARNWYEGGGQQLGIATGKGTSVGIVDNNRIGESDWGFKDGHDPVTWRSSLVADASAPDDGPPISGAPRPSVEKEDLPPPPGMEGCPINSRGQCPWAGGRGSVPGSGDKMQTLPDYVPGSQDRNMPTAGGWGSFLGETNQGARTIKR